MIPTAPARWSSSATHMPKCGSTPSMPSPRSPTGDCGTWQSPPVRTPLLPYTKTNWWRVLVVRQLAQVRHQPDQPARPRPGDRVRRKSSIPQCRPAVQQRPMDGGIDRLLSFHHCPKAKFVVIGNIPELPQTGPDCIARHTDDVQACSATMAASKTPYHHAEAEAVESVGGRYIDPTPWFCSKVCTPVIGNYDVYFDHWHMMGPYALHLTNVLAQALQLPASRIMTTRERPGNGHLFADESDHARNRRRPDGP